MGREMGPIFCQRFALIVLGFVGLMFLFYGWFLAMIGTCNGVLTYFHVNPNSCRWLHPVSSKLSSVPGINHASAGTAYARPRTPFNFAASPANKANSLSTNETSGWRTLILLRHAKSDWITNMDDKDRPLKQIGVEDAITIGKYVLNHTDYHTHINGEVVNVHSLPQHIVCSTTVRTRQTMSAWLSALNNGTDPFQYTDSPEVHFTSQNGSAEESVIASIEYSDEVYQNPNWHGLLNVIQGVNNDINRLMIVGHHPTLDKLAKHLLSPSQTYKREARSISKYYSTAGFSVFLLRVSNWRDVRHREGTLVTYINPQDLKTENN